MSMGGTLFFAVTNNTVQNVSRDRISIKGIVWHNDDASIRFMQLFNVSEADVVLGTTVPNMIIQLGADTTDSWNLFNGVFETACSFAITSTRTGSTGGTASDIMFVVL